MLRFHGRVASTGLPGRPIWMVRSSLERAVLPVISRDSAVAGEGRPWRELSGGGKRLREASGFPQVSLGLGMVAGYQAGRLGGARLAQFGAGCTACRLTGDHGVQLIHECRLAGAAPVSVKMLWQRSGIGYGVRLPLLPLSTAGRATDNGVAGDAALEEFCSRSIAVA